MADGEDILGSLPPPRVKWKEQMEDIKEATLEGSQFEAQFPEDRTSVQLRLDSPRPQTPRYPRPSSGTSPAEKSRPSSEVTPTSKSQTIEEVPAPAPKVRPSSDVPPKEKVNRPKTTLRRTTSERSNNDVDINSPVISRKSTQEFASPSTPREQNSTTARKLSVDNQKPFTVLPSKKSGNVANGVHSNSNKAGERKDGIYSYNKNGNVSDRSEPSSRVSSQLSFNQRSDSVGRVSSQYGQQKSALKGENGNKSALRSRPFTSTEVVQLKGKVMENGW